jgi:hypothetical protein
MGPHVKVRKAGNEPANKTQGSALQYQPGFGNQFVTEALPGARRVLMISAAWLMPENTALKGRDYYPTSGSTPMRFQRVPYVGGVCGSSP